MIKEGLIHEGELHTCERLYKEAMMTQCFNCQAYGHIQRACKSKASCGVCAGAHRSQDCPKDTTTSNKCKLYGGNHTVWSRSCPNRVQEFERMRNAKERSAPLFIQEQTNANASLSQTAPQAPRTVENDWQLITYPKKGRPSGIQRAASIPGQSRLATTGSKRQRREFVPIEDSAMNSAPSTEPPHSVLSGDEELYEEIHTEMTDSNEL